MKTYEKQIKTVKKTIAQFKKQIKNLTNKSQTTKIQTHQNIK